MLVKHTMNPSMIDPGSGARPERPRLRRGDQDRHVSGQRAAGDPQAAGAHPEVPGMPQVPRHGQVQGRRRPLSHQVRLGEALPHIPG